MVLDIRISVWESYKFWNSTCCLSIFQQTSERTEINYVIDQDREYFRMPFVPSNQSLQERTARL